MSITINHQTNTISATAGSITIDGATPQPLLISGTNIRTINGTTLLGSGDIVAGNVTTTDVQTLVNKTLTSPVLNSATASTLTLNDGYTEEVFAVTGTTPQLSPASGSIQTWTLTAASTPTAGTWASGQSLTLMIDDGSAYTINWASMAITWKTDSGSAPTLNTTGYTVIQLWKIGSVVYGARVGNA